MDQNDSACLPALWSVIGQGLSPRVLGCSSLQPRQSLQELTAEADCRPLPPAAGCPSLRHIWAEYFVSITVHHLCPCNPFFMYIQRTVPPGLQGASLPKEAFEEEAIAGEIPALQLKLGLCPQLTFIVSLHHPFWESQLLPSPSVIASAGRGSWPKTMTPNLIPEGFMLLITVSSQARISALSIKYSNWATDHFEACVYYLDPTHIVPYLHCVTTTLPPPFEQGQWPLTRGLLFFLPAGPWTQEAGSAQEAVIAYTTMIRCVILMQRYKLNSILVGCLFIGLLGDAMFYKVNHLHSSESSPLGSPLVSTGYYYNCIYLATSN